MSILKFLENSDCTPLSDFFHHFSSYFLCPSSSDFVLNYDNATQAFLGLRQSREEVVAIMCFGRLATYLPRGLVVRDPAARDRSRSGLKPLLRRAPICGDISEGKTDAPRRTEYALDFFWPGWTQKLPAAAAHCDGVFPSLATQPVLMLLVVSAQLPLAPLSLVR